MQKIKKTTLLLIMILMILLSTSCKSLSKINDEPNLSAEDTPSEISLSMTTNPTSSINITWTTIKTTLSNPIVIVWEKGKDESTAIKFSAQVETREVTNSNINGDNDKPITVKNFYKASITGLRSNKEYNYRCGAGKALSGTSTFETSSDNDEAYTFIYVTDPQVSDGSSNAWNANLDIIKKMYPDAKFMYIAGDFTDTASDEGEWETFFNQKQNKRYNETYSGSLVSELPIVGTMGNHDGVNAGIGGLASHFAFDSSITGVPMSYAFNYGEAHIIILNLENAYSKDNGAFLEEQAKFLKKEAETAKKDGSWVIVGFHKAIYSGANHMDDEDVIFNRKYWGPILASLDVDVVLQGHDHVLSRGFVKASGEKANITKQVAMRTYTAIKPANAPLYYVGNAGGSLKFYPPIMSNEWIKKGDPVAFDFNYLDINSALPALYKNKSGQILNPGPCTNDELDGTDPDYYRTPTFTAITVSKDSIDFKTFMTGFNDDANAIIRDTFMYDSLTINKE